MVIGVAILHIPEVQLRSHRARVQVQVRHIAQVRAVHHHQVQAEAVTGLQAPVGVHEVQEVQAQEEEAVREAAAQAQVAAVHAVLREDVNYISG